MDGYPADATLRLEDAQYVNGMGWGDYERGLAERGAAEDGAGEAAAAVETSAGRHPSAKLERRPRRAEQPREKSNLERGMRRRSSMT